MSKRFYHVCDPNLPVARAKNRGRTRIGRAHIFLLHADAPEFVGACESAVSMKHRGNKRGSTGISVPLDMAKRLANEDLSHLYLLYTENIIFSDEQEFVQHVIDTLTPDEPWYAPAGISMPFRPKDYQKDAIDFIDAKLSENPKVSLL